MGAREPKDFILTSEQRRKIVEYVEGQIGKPYAQSKTVGVLFGLVNALYGMGLERFNCVGLVEKAYEESGANQNMQGIPQGIVKHNEKDLLSPARQYSYTKPAGGTEVWPTIKSATLTPSSGTNCTQILAQIEINHPYGLGQIDHVTYVTDEGLVNPEILINDNGISGDLKAGDGIFSAKANSGGDPARGSVGMTFTVTDKSGKSDSRRLVYTYTGSCTAKLINVETSKDFFGLTR